MEIPCFLWLSAIMFGLLSCSGAQETPDACDDAAEVWIWPQHDTGPREGAPGPPGPMVLRSKWGYTLGEDVALTCRVFKPTDQAWDTADLALWVNAEKIMDDMLTHCTNSTTGAQFIRFEFNPDDYRYRGNQVRATCWADYGSYRAEDSVLLLTHVREGRRDTYEVRNPLDVYEPYGSAASATVASALVVLAGLAFHPVGGS